MFLFYWLFLLISLIVSIISLVKKYFLTGILAFLLTLVTPVWQFLFFMSNAWSETGVNEFIYLFHYAIAGSIAAVCIITGYLLVIFLFIMNLRYLFKKTDLKSN